MGRKNEAGAPALAPETKGVTPGTGTPTALERPGFSIWVPGKLLKIGSKLWTEEQRQKGIWLRGMYLMGTEEEAAIVEAQREGKLAAIGLFQFRKSLIAMANNEFETTVEMTDEGEVEVRTPVSGPWMRITTLQTRSYWEEFGPQGRNLFTQAYQLAHTPSEEERAAALASFRIEV